MDRAALEDFASLSQARLAALAADVQAQRQSLVNQPRWSAGDLPLAEAARAIDQLADAIASPATPSASTHE